MSEIIKEWIVHCSYSFKQAWKYLLCWKTLLMVLKLSLGHHKGELLPSAPPEPLNLVLLVMSLIKRYDREQVDWKEPSVDGMQTHP